MIKIGIIGMGNVAWNVHLPVLLARKDVKVCWACDKELNFESALNKKNIPMFKELRAAIKHEKCDVALLSTAYSEREKIFEQIKDKFEGIYFEKPFALSLKEHDYFSGYFKNYGITIGYQRRHMGIVKTMRHIINQKIFGPLVSVKIDFGDIYYNFDGFRSQKKKSGGGIFLEGGSHWIDAVLFTTLAKDVRNFKSNKKIDSDLDIEAKGSFTIINYEDLDFNCDFYITNLENTSNTIKYAFKNCTVDLSLFENDSDLRISSENKKLIIKDDEFSNFPSKSLEVGWSFWDEFLNSFKNKIDSKISAKNFILTSKVIELFYGK
ncbi:Gfo/Idh/MocA family oxidoreductase [Candidatus Pelagibacter sp.]|nr:Gfo/Idh/MocA family oxidoreductase [Candidatus Pelagibacter sp.]